MGLRANPSQRQLRLGFELRRMRAAAGFTAAEAGKYASIGGAHLAHMEAGRTAIPTHKLRELLRAYGIESATYIESLVALSEASGQGWWTDYKHHVAEHTRDLAELECMAPTQRVFDMVYMPGLLQTPEYMRALAASTPHPDTPAEALERRLEFRIRRQSVLTGDSVASYHAIIHEAAFHMSFVPRSTLRDQLSHLVETARLPHVTIQIVPFRSASFPAVGTPFTLFGARPPELSTVYLEHDAGSVFFGDQTHVSRYEEIFDRLSTVALEPLSLTSEQKFSSGRDSLSFLQHLAYTL